MSADSIRLLCFTVTVCDLKKAHSIVQTPFFVFLPVAAEAVVKQSEKNGFLILKRQHTFVFKLTLHTGEVSIF